MTSVDSFSKRRVQGSRKGSAYCKSSITSPGGRFVMRGSFCVSHPSLFLRTLRNLSQEQFNLTKGV
jgi:hypothetical protein